MSWRFASFAALALACVLAAVLDVWKRRIPNWLCAATALAGLVAGVASSNLAEGANHALHMTVALLLGMLLFKLGAVGGGDAKFYAAIAAWFPLAAAPMLALDTAVSGLILVVAWFTYRRALGLRVRAASTSPFDRLPYGVAIGLGAAMASTTMLVLEG